MNDKKATCDNPPENPDDPPRRWTAPHISLFPGDMSGTILSGITLTGRLPVPGQEAVAPEIVTPGLWQEAGRYARALHNLAVDGYGRPNKNGTAPFPCLRSLFTPLLETVAGVFHPDTVSEETVLDGFRHPVLVHGAMTPENIRVDKAGRFAGISGVENGFFGASGWDLAIVRETATGDGFSRFLDGYGEADMPETNYFAALIAAARKKGIGR